MSELPQINPESVTGFVVYPGSKIWKIDIDDPKFEAQSEVYTYLDKQGQMHSARYYYCLCKFKKNYRWKYIRRYYYLNEGWFKIKILGTVNYNGLRCLEVCLYNELHKCWL